MFIEAYYDGMIGINELVEAYYTGMLPDSENVEIRAIMEENGIEVEEIY